eukprot:NODE_1039_length_511_cov_105.632812_g1029_i0.p3 GENE.NODE_1039_length_511_cov_105.632812_g1029_i0~~NODE_1039_length_511_cov_105.632812_g1029_i0.p3  ORF type:complete len:65 (+),score=0.38 NODE_1039_length_511_cov_105.632812_g1029_i0:314-508(+)
MLLGIDTVTVVLPIRRRQQALLFIEADRLCFDPYQLRQLTNAHQPPPQRILYSIDLIVAPCTLR